MEEVILVDYQDRELGVMEKLQAHKEVKLHRAFSVFLLDGTRVLLQKRAATKYHCPNLWANTCCSHPRRNESLEAAVTRRLDEELGIQPMELKPIGHFIYLYQFDNGLAEFEYDHVWVGQFDGSYHLNPEEVSAVEWVELEALQADILLQPHRYTPWLIMALAKVLESQSA
ncbi:MAG: isopentenyl-diphosphate Delta-isomerase [Erysipelotrichaceae bacterium]